MGVIVNRVLRAFSTRDEPPGGSECRPHKTLSQRKSRLAPSRSDPTGRELCRPASSASTAARCSAPFPKILWEKSNPADEHNRIPMEARALLLDGGPGKRVLVDCGIGGDYQEKYGEKLGAKFAEMYAVTSDASIGHSLAALGLSETDIDHVILTHLHFDHAGGATRWQEGRLVPTFPKARYYVQRANFETASTPNLREKASYYTANFRPLDEAGVLQILDGPVENLLPGISVEVTNGHTRGQQIVKVTDGSTTLVYCGDLIPTSTHVRLPWVMGYDLDPLTLMEEKKDRARASRARRLVSFLRARSVSRLRTRGNFERRFRRPRATRARVSLID